jgi:hypothetical protein
MNNTFVFSPANIIVTPKHLSQAIITILTTRGLIKTNERSASFPNTMVSKILLGNCETSTWLMPLMWKVHRASQKDMLILMALHLLEANSLAQMNLSWKRGLIHAWPTTIMFGQNVNIEAHGLQVRRFHGNMGIA